MARQSCNGPLRAWCPGAAHHPWNCRRPALRSRTHSRRLRICLMPPRRIYHVRYGTERWAIQLRVAGVRVQNSSSRFVLRRRRNPAECGWENGPNPRGIPAAPACRRTSRRITTPRLTARSSEATVHACPRACHRIGVGGKPCSIATDGAQPALIGKTSHPDGLLETPAVCE